MTGLAAKRSGRGRPNKSTMLKKNKKKNNTPLESSLATTSIPEAPEAKQEQASSTLEGPSRLEGAPEKEPSKRDEESERESSKIIGKNPKMEEENWELGSGEELINGLLMDTIDERGKGSEERESSVWSSNVESGEWYSAAHSSINSNLDNEWLNWDWDDDGVLGQNVWENFKEPSWFWANSNGET